MTIQNQSEDCVNNPSTLALAALGWILSEERRAQRFLDLTGLSPDSLRHVIEEVSTHRAVLDFLCAHEPDLVGAAESLGIRPEKLAAARREMRK